jgi:foldase protein PrsA
VTHPLLHARTLALVLASVLALAACSSGDQAAAEVGDATITNDQLAADVKLFGFLTALSGSPCGQPIEGETQESACARLTLSNLIQEELVKGYAADNGIVTDEAAVDEAMTQLETSVGGPEELDSQLAADDLTRSDLEALATRLLLFNAVQESLTTADLTDERIEQLYEENIAQYTTLDVSHILVDSQREAEEIAAEVTPESFADVAEERSQDPGSAPNGGSLGSIVEATFTSQYDPTFVEATLVLRPGEISEPVQTQFGWHVIHLEDIRVTELEDVREQIVASAAPQAFTGWMQEALRSAEITVNPRYGTLDVTTGQVEPIRSTNTDSPFQPTSAPAQTGP